MSGNLSAFELLHRENLFIRLKNQGKNLDEIALLLDVEKELVEKWNEEFEKAMEKLKNYTDTQNDFFFKRLYEKSLTWIELVHKKTNGYIPKHKFTYLGRVMADLYILTKTNKEYEIFKKELPEELLNKVKQEAQNHLEILEKHCITIDDVSIDTDKSVFFKPKNTASRYDGDVQKAIQFWFNFNKDILNQLITKPSLDKTTFVKKYYHTLPYAIKQVKIQNYHSIKELHIENLNVDAQWIFLFGENGFGKTSILQAITLVLFNNLSQNTTNNGQNTRISTELINLYDNEIIHLYEHKEIPNLVCYGSSRLNMGIEDTKEDEMQKSGLTYSLFHTDGRLLNIEKYLREWFLAKDERFEKVIEAFKTIIPYLHDIQVVKNEQREFEVHYFEKAITENGESEASFQKVSFNHLAAGLKSVLAMVGDMFIRLYRTQPLVTNPSELVGIAIIDELELHLHPKWQIKLPQLLSTVFPKVQFIVSTHSAIPLLGATPNAVFIKVTRDKENGIQAQKMDIDLKNLTPNQLFYFLFDMESITSVNNTNLSEVRTEDTKAEFLKNDEVKARLKAFETKKADTDFPDDLFEPENLAVK